MAIGLGKMFGYENIQVKEGVLNNLELHFSNEPARHKLLDVIGDMSLVGKPIKGTIVANRPGHRVNNQFARLLREKMK